MLVVILDTFGTRSVLNSFLKLDSIFDSLFVHFGSKGDLNDRAVGSPWPPFLDLFGPLPKKGPLASNFGTCYNVLSLFLIFVYMFLRSFHNSDTHTNEK